jgi:hypothetical protein
MMMMIWDLDYYYSRTQPVQVGPESCSLFATALLLLLPLQSW